VAGGEGSFAFLLVKSPFLSNLLNPLASITSQKQSNPLTIAIAKKIV